MQKSTNKFCNVRGRKIFLSKDLNYMFCISNNIAPIKNDIFYNTLPKLKLFSLVFTDFRSSAIASFSNQPPKKIKEVERKKYQKVRLIDGWYKTSISLIVSTISQPSLFSVIN